jgi:DNA-binding GntR family transcriptional regulator
VLEKSKPRQRRQPSGRLNRGVVVGELSAAGLRELFQVRLPLETLAATEAARRRSEKSLQTLESTLRKMDAASRSDAWHTLHERFHEELYSLSELPRLWQMIAGLRGQMRPYAKLYHDDKSATQPTVSVSCAPVRLLG